MRLFTSILLLMLVVSIVPTTIVGGLSVSDTREMLVRDAQELAQERVKQLRLKVRGLLDEPARAALGLARVPGFVDLPLAEQRPHVASVLSQRREVVALTVFDADKRRAPGLQAFAVSDVAPTEVAAHEARARALLEGLTAAGVRYGPVPGEGAPAVTLAFALGEPPRGYVAADVSLAELPALLAAEQDGSPSRVYVVDLAGRLVADGGGGRAGADWRAHAPVAHLSAAGPAAARGDLLQVGQFGQGEHAVVAAYTVLPELGWAIVSEQPVELAYRQVQVMERRVLWGALVAVLVAAGLAAVFSRTLTRPVRRLIGGALKLARGEFGTQVEAKEKNELGELTRHFNYMSQQLLAYDGETRRLYESLEQGYLETIVALANSIDSKDAYTRGHSQRVGDVAVEIGRELGLTERELKLLQFGGILHDIGKIGIPEAILCKQTRLSDDEMVVMRDHPTIGDSIVTPISFLASVRSCVRSHHERWDGTGYPDRLKGEEIPLLARIVACADTFDACTSTRPYQKAMPLTDALAVLERLSGQQLDPSVVAAMRRVVEKRGVRVEGRRDPVRIAS